MSAAYIQVNINNSFSSLNSGALWSGCHTRLALEGNDTVS